MDLTANQAKNATAIVSAGRSMGMSTRDIQIALMTALTESNLLMYANSSVPQSLSYSHDAVGSDTDSLGLFQQRPSAGWGSISQLMDPQYDARKFYSVLKTKGGRISQSPWLAAQSVQISAYSDGSNYQANWANAQELYNEVTGGHLPISNGTTAQTASSINPIGGIASLWTILGDFNSPDWWKRVGKFTTGGILVLIVMLYLLHESGAVGATVNAGKKVVATGAKVAAVAAV